VNQIGYIEDHAIREKALKLIERWMEDLKKEEEMQLVIVSQEESLNESEENSTKEI
jgi:hypothetical protein